MSTGSKFVSEALRASNDPPSQFWDTVRPSQDQPLKKLAFAIVEDALASLGKTCDLPQAEAHKQFMEDFLWFTDPGRLEHEEEKCITFETCCDILGLNQQRFVSRITRAYGRFANDQR